MTDHLLLLIGYARSSRSIATTASVILRSPRSASARLHLRQTILSVNYQLTLGQPKTLRGERKITLDAETIRVLEAHRASQRRERRPLGAGYHDQDLVFAREDGGPIHPDYFSQTFDRAVKRLKLPKFRLHDYADVRVMPIWGAKPLRRMVIGRFLSA